MKLDDREKLQVLLAAFRDRSAHLKFWRQRLWRLAAGLVLVDLAIGLFSLFVRSWHTDSLAVPVLLLALLGTLLLLRFEKLADASKRRLIEIEDALGFFEEGLFIEGLSLQPVERKQETRIDEGSGLLVLVIWVGAVFTLVTLGL
jgi:hypothetical protein